jgi:hypothetical protein
MVLSVLSLSPFFGVTRGGVRLESDRSEIAALFSLLSLFSIAGVV